MRVSFNPLAERELDDAVQYYEFESRGRGVAFLDEVERTLKEIDAFPEAAPLVHSFVRGKLVRRFAFGILYRPHSDGVSILAVMNLKRRPAYWVGRS